MVDRYGGCVSEEGELLELVVSTDSKQLARQNRLQLLILYKG